VIGEPLLLSGDDFGRTDVEVCGWQVLSERVPMLFLPIDFYSVSDFIGHKQQPCLDHGEGQVYGSTHTV
jgi:hypothetical protein